eukprot:5409411-Prymnesium_polylepis.1
MADVRVRQARRILVLAEAVALLWMHDDERHARLRQLVGEQVVEGDRAAACCAIARDHALLELKRPLHAANVVLGRAAARPERPHPVAA